MSVCIYVQTREEHILAITLDPAGEWLACACLDGGIYLIPLISLTLVSHKLPSRQPKHYSIYFS